MLPRGFAFLCLHAAVSIAPVLASKASACVLMSGTLSPLESSAAELGTACHPSAHHLHLCPPPLPVPPRSTGFGYKSYFAIGGGVRVGGCQAPDPPPCLYPRGIVGHHACRVLSAVYSQTEMPPWISNSLLLHVCGHRGFVAVGQCSVVVLEPIGRLQPRGSGNVPTSLASNVQMPGQRRSRPRSKQEQQLLAQRVQAEVARIAPTVTAPPPAAAAAAAVTGTAAATAANARSKAL